jgi:8-amino-7-oxononanoate synthase
MAKPPASDLLRGLESDLAALESRAQLRRLEIVAGVNLYSNDYLGLAADPRLQAAVAAAVNEGVPVASTGSRLLSGNAVIWEQLEAEIAAQFQVEAALYFNSGYAANIGLLASVLRPGDIVFSDSANHASLIDGIRLSGARKVIFPHLDLGALENELCSATQSGGEVRKLVVVESVFSMDGDRAPIAELVALAQRHGAELLVDEAHATGVFGPEGRGLVAEAGLTREVFATMHTCGKALAGFGAFVCGSETLKQYLVNRARPFIFSTALPPYVAAQMRAALRIVAGADAERRRLAELAAFLRERLCAAGFDTAGSESQIVPVVLGSNERALAFAARLCREGFAVRAIRPPTVPQGTARLRFSLHANLTSETLTRLVESLVRIRDEFPVPEHETPRETAQRATGHSS